MKRFFSIVFVLLCFFSVFASGLPFTVNKASVDIVVGKDAVHKISETYEMDYQVRSHGFVRYIPIDYSEKHAVVSNVVCSDRYERGEEDGWFYLKIGSSSSEIYGKKDYRLDYLYDLGADTNDGYDEFYYNLWGSDWDAPVKELSFSIVLEEDADKIQVWFNRGKYGAVDSVEYTIEEKSGYSVISGKVFNLQPYEALTMRIQFSDGWYVGAREPYDYRELFSIINPVVSFLILGFAALVWLKNGKDKLPIVSAKFDPPDNLSPLAVGFLIDQKVDDKDLTSMLFYWADKGLLGIIEKKKDKFSFVKLDNIPADAPEFEKELFNGFFKHCKVGETITLEEVSKNDFYSVMQKTKLTVPHYFKKKKALVSGKSIGFSVVFGILSFVPGILLALAQDFREFPDDSGIAMFTICLFANFLLMICYFNLFNKWYLRKTNFYASMLCALPPIVAFVILALIASSVFQVVCSVLCFSLISFFSVIMPKRSEYGHKMFEDILGFREYIDKVSMSELVMLIDENPQYYYHILSYAIVLGLEKEWAKKFEVTGIPDCTWYVGYRTMDRLMLMNLYARMGSAVKANVVPAQVKGGKSIGGVGGGFNLGGFAGGGFGGGGGHAW